MSLELIPESAPFNAEQRAWLNGFFDGVLRSLDATQAQNGRTTSLAAAAALSLPSLSPNAFSHESSAPSLQEELPWHDSSLPIEERLKLAEDRPVPLRLMAAMAQLDCGSCGYQCQTYAQAIATGAEKNLTLCSPGGTETIKAIRLLVKQVATAPTPAASVSNLADKPAPVPPAPVPHVVVAKFVSADQLNGPDSSKDTRHVVIDIAETGLKYNVGDALGVVARNCSELIDQVIHAAGHNMRSQDYSKLAMELGDRCLRTITEELVELVYSSSTLSQSIAAPRAMTKAELLAADEFYTWDVLELLQHVGPLCLDATTFVDTLSMNKPRLYSISSSQSMHPSQVHLTVGRVEDAVRGRPRKGVASTMCADRLACGDNLSVFVKPHHGFTVPSDNSRDMIMVGPGTGIAPFMAFLQQREFDQATGRNWLFFGDQRRQADFLYREQLEQWQHSRLLTHLDLAFSRDQAEKFYVQHLMQQRATEMFDWLMDGACFLVCGDAKRMAKDVEETLISILQEHGAMDHAAAKQWFKNRKAEGRIAFDVY